MEQLGEFFRIKFNEKETHTQTMLKQNASIFFNTILKKQIITNPVEI